MAIRMNKIEFDLTIKKYGFSTGQYDHRPKEDEKPELIEKLEFKTLSAKEVLRKLIDYLSE